MGRGGAAAAITPATAMAAPPLTIAVPMILCLSICPCPCLHLFVLDLASVVLSILSQFALHPHPLVHAHLCWPACFPATWSHWFGCRLCLFGMCLCCCWCCMHALPLHSAHPPFICRVSHRYRFTRGASKTGVTGMSMVLIFGTP